jgi:RNA polymerase sigma factor (sigma-70 family)
VDWDAIYQRLLRDCNDTIAWTSMQEHVRCWARGVLAGRAPHLIEDAVAETCATTVVTLHNARSAETFAGFAYGHFLNVRRRLIRDQAMVQRTQTLDVELPLAAVIDEPDPEIVALVRNAVEALPERERRAVSMRYFDELSSTAIAAALGVSNVNARRIVFNGLRRLRMRLATGPDYPECVVSELHELTRVQPVRRRETPEAPVPS